MDRAAVDRDLPSPVAGDAKIYQANEEGEVFVIAAGPKCEILKTNALGETCLASPAISEGVIYFRTRHKVIAIGETK